MGICNSIKILSIFIISGFLIFTGKIRADADAVEAINALTTTTVAGFNMLSTTTSAGLGVLTSTTQAGFDNMGLAISSQKRQCVMDLMC
jgi:hypothetical protein